MKFNYSYIFTFLLATTCILFACKKSYDDRTFITADKYINPIKGKFIVYRLDSTITQSFGKFFRTFSYTVKDSIADVFTDNTGRNSYRIIRMQFDSATRRFNPTNTFVLSPRGNNVEFTQNNFRYISLVSPVSENQTWLGNNFVTQPPYYNNHTSFNDWMFRYKDIGASKQFGSLTFPNTITVVQKDSTESTKFDAKNYSSFEKGYEIYAESIGLIYRDIMAWEYQVSTTVQGCKLVKPKANGMGNDTTNVDCQTNASRCDSLRRQPNHRIISCDTIRGEFNFDGYGVRQTILSHN